jgi:hypothetical protein
MSKISKLGLGIVAFEGTEHIKNIAYEVRNECDYIVVCLQRKSYVGDDISREDIDECERLLSKKLIDNIIWFEFDNNLNKRAKDGVDIREVPRRIEADKRNYIIQHLEDNGCSHAIVVDSDEFYDGTQFKIAKKCINDNDADTVTYCQYVNYWRDYQHYIVWPFKTFVPFISPIRFRYEFRCGCFGFAVDPTRIYKLEIGDSYSIFEWNIVHMNHFSWIRKDIRKKINSWSSKKYFTQQFLDHVYNKYATWKEYECACVLFGTPGGKMCIEYLGRQYIHPHYRLNEIV